MKFALPQKKLIKIFKKYRIAAAYLFGSAAQGSTHPQSDIDIAVRFPENFPLKKRLLLENELTALLHGNVDLANLQGAPLQLQFRIFQARRLLYAKNPAEEVMKKAKALSLYHDYKYYFDRFTEFETQRMARYGLLQKSL